MLEPSIAPYGTTLMVALPTNIGRGWKWMEVANTLAYNDMATITAVKKVDCTGLPVRLTALLEPSSLG
jgi:hypothetical protein